MITLVFVHVNVKPVLAEEPLVTRRTLVFELPAMKRTVVTPKGSIVDSFEPAQITEQNCKEQGVVEL